MSEATLNDWRQASAEAATCKAEAMQEALVALDAVRPLFGERHLADVRAVEALMRERIRQYQDDAHEALEGTT